jgi:transposase
LIHKNYQESIEFDGEIELDESYFGGSQKGKRGGKVYTSVINDVQGKTLYPIIKNRVLPDSIVYTDYWPGYNILDVSEFKHYRINHSKTFVDKYNHINGIENFWNQAKRHMRKFNGVTKDHFHLFLKECEWRFNTKKLANMRAQLLQWLGDGF